VYDWAGRDDWDDDEVMYDCSGRDACRHTHSIPRFIHRGCRTMSHVAHCRPTSCDGTSIPQLVQGCKQMSLSSSSSSCMTIMSSCCCSCASLLSSSSITSKSLLASITDDDQFERDVWHLIGIERGCVWLQEPSIQTRTRD
jgi:hypothetical protein